MSTSRKYKGLLRSRDGIIEFVERIERFLKCTKEFDEQALKIRMEKLEQKWDEFEDLQNDIEGMEDSEEIMPEHKHLRAAFEEKYFEAWQAVRNPFEFSKPPEKFHQVTDCMHVASEEGEFFFKRTAPIVATPQHGRLVDVMSMAPVMEVCGIYFVTDPDKLVEVTVKRMDVNCDTGGLMSFVDGWELNGMYFPTEYDHPKSMDQRINEFCNDPKMWPFSPVRKAFRSSQNAALVQYRIPISGSFTVSVRYLHNPDPCNIMAEGVAPYYTLRNRGALRNCSLTAVFPAVMSVVGVDVGGRKDGVNYDCDRPDAVDRLEIGGSSGLDSANMDKSSTICGKSMEPGPEQGIFCGTSTARLISSGRHANQALVSVRLAEENDITLATVLCDMRRKKK